MKPGTAAAAASVSIIASLYPSVAPSATINVMARYRRWFTNSNPQTADYKPEASIYRASMLRPGWLSKTRKAILDSVPRGTNEMLEEGQWISQAVANAATDFLETTADLLPEQPFIYSSRQGDLVAEFSARNGNLTTIVSPAFVILFAIVDGMPRQHRITDAAALRDELRQFLKPLMTGDHGSLATQK